MVRSRQSRIKNVFAENRLFAVRSVIAGLIAGALLIGVGARLFYLQVLRHDYYSNLSQGNRIRTEPIPPSRGLILDRHGVVLADNLPAFQIELVREQVGDTKSLDATLATLVGIGLLRPEEVGNIRRTVLLHKVYESVPIKLQLTEEEMALFAVHRFQFSGVDIRTRLARHYPLGETAVHAIGYVSAINEQDLKQIDSDEYAGTSLIGKLGVEAAYEQQLHGKRGSREILVNAAGRPVDKQGDYTPHLDVRPPIAGDDLILGHGHPRAESCGGCARGQTRFGRRARSEDRRCDRAGEQAGIRSQRLRPRTDGGGVHRAPERHRHPAAESGIARRLSAGIDGQAAVCLGRAEVQHSIAAPDLVLQRRLHPARQHPPIPR